MSNREYPGDSVRKSMARYELYRVVPKAVEKVRRNHLAHVLIFAGPNCPELPLIRELLNVPEDHILIVDHKKDCREEASTLAPKAHVFASADEAYKYLDGIGGALMFANLDLMGSYYAKDAPQIIEGACKRLCPKGVVSVTYIRAHEGGNQTGFRSLLADHDIPYTAWKAFTDTQRNQFRHVFCEYTIARAHVQFNPKPVTSRCLLAHDYVGSGNGPMAMHALQF
jgi:hypothetical protein